MLQNYYVNYYHSGIFVGLRVDVTPGGYTYMINNSKASVILVENSEQVHNILQVCVPIATQTKDIQMKCTKPGS